MAGNATNKHRRDQSRPPPSLLQPYQLAFLTPGKRPSSAHSRKLYYHRQSAIVRFVARAPTRHTLDILKSLNMPRPLPPSVHRFRI